MKSHRNLAYIYSQNGTRVIEHAVIHDSAFLKFTGMLLALTVLLGKIIWLVELLSCVSSRYEAYAYEDCGLILITAETASS